MGYDVVGITTDGGDNIVRAAEYVYPHIPRQRCMVHVRRECLNRITLQPRSPEARALKDLVLRIGDVRTANDRLWWLRSFRDWAEHNAAFACEKGSRPGGQTYFVRDDLRKAYEPTCISKERYPTCSPSSTIPGFRRPRTPSRRSSGISKTS